MRIVQVITRLIVGGAQENTILSCEGLHARGHEVTLISGPTSGPEGSLVEQARRGPYRFEELPDLVRQVSPWHDLRALRALRERFVVLRPDVVHTHSSKAGVLGRMAAWHCLKQWHTGPTVIHTIHGMSFNRTQPALVRAAYRMVERYCAKRCHAIVSVADAMTAQALAAGVGRPEQYTTIRSGMVTADFDPARHDRSALRARWGVGADEVLVGTVARLFVNKGYEELMEIMSLAAEGETRPAAGVPRLRYLWIGGGNARERYEAELKRRGLRQRVIFAGLLPPEEMPAALAAIDILAHTSRWEGLPRAVVQALLMEKPAVSFDIDGAPEVVRPGRTGELAPLGDARRFADALTSLAREPARRSAYGREGRRLCLAEFDHRAMAERLESLYLELHRR